MPGEDFYLDAVGALDKDNSDEADLEAVSKWIDDRVERSVQSDDKVARLVMRCVLRAALRPHEKPSAQKMCRQVERWSAVSSRTLDWL